MAVASAGSGTSSPSLPPSTKQSQLVSRAKLALSGSRVDKDFVWGNAEVRRAVSKRFLPLLFSFLLFSIATFCLCTHILSEDFDDSIASSHLAAMFSDCSGEDAECRILARQRLTDRITICTGGMALGCVLAAPLNAATLALVCRGDYARGVWTAWMALHYVVIFGMVLSVVLMPVAYAVYWTLQNMKLYAVTFEEDVPLE